MMKRTTKLQLTALALALGVSNAAQANLIITEYIEGSSNNKAIELTNLSDNKLDLTGYQVNLFSNGATESKYVQVLSGELNAGASLVIYNANATESFKQPAPQGMASTITYFNGDDALTITYNGVVVDSFGQVGADPGTSWKAEGFDSKDKTLRRLTSITTGDIITDDQFPGAVNEWQTFDKDTSGGLGCSGVENCDGSTSPTTPTEPTEPTEPPVIDFPTAKSPLLFSEYVEGSSYNKAIEIGNTGNVEVALAGYSVALYSNGATSAKYTLALEGTIAAQDVLVIYNKGAKNAFKILNGVESNVTGFNGDDALLLTLDGAVVDSFGQRGTDPGTSWVSGSFNSKDKTLRRKITILAGDKIPGDQFPGVSLGQWVVLDKDTSNGLGCIGEGACEGIETIPEELPSDGECTNCPVITKVADSASFNENTYYANALVADDSQLRYAINQDISKNHKKLSYSEVWSVLTFSDEDPLDSGKVIEIYSGRSIGKGLNAGLIGNSGDAWNREHVWAKSHGFPSSSQFGYTDAHHLRQADASINSQRSNLDFDNGGEPLIEAPANAKDRDSFEPRDEVKGDVARMMFYMDVRYAGNALDNTPDIVLVDRVGTENGSPEFGKLCTLYTWHQEDPVSDWERNRNNVVFEYQGNRNPFIDRPEWVQQIFGDACGDAPVVNQAPIATPTILETVIEGSGVFIAANATDPDNDVLTYLWTQVSTTDISFDATSDTLVFNAPAVDSNTQLSFTLLVSDGINSIESAISFTVVAEVIPPVVVQPAVSHWRKIFAYFKRLTRYLFSFFFG
ncbi:MAG: endonuclease [Psychrobium sp.]|nr:endonuclease [Psychrobium sp.]